MRRHGAQGRTVVVLLLFILALVVMMAAVDRRVHQTPPSKYLVPPPNRFRVTESPKTWHGQPVYRIENITNHPLQRVVPSSWSEQVIPILFKGDSLPNLSTFHPNLHPPYDLNPGESLWIVASKHYPYQLTIMWMVNGRDRYQMYQVPAQQTQVGVR